MDFLDALSEELLKTVTPRLAAAITAEVVAAVKADAVFRYSEEEAAAKLGVATTTLAQIRRDKQIEFTYSVPPTLGADKKLHGGRISYLPRHLDEYLARNEQKHFFGNLRGV